MEDKSNCILCPWVVLILILDYYFMETPKQQANFVLNKSK